jgi:hypothetical protein
MLAAVASFSPAVVLAGLVRRTQTGAPDRVEPVDLAQLAELAARRTGV